MRLKNKTYFFFLLLIVAIFPYCYLSFFAQPISDDFCFAHYYQKNSFLELLKKSYLEMNGRYIANILMYLNPISFNYFFAYKLVPLLMISLTLIGSLLLVNQLFYFLSSLNRRIIALVFTLLFLYNLPVISEGLYWYTAAVIYQGGIICTIFYISIFIKLVRRKNNFTDQIVLTSLLFLVCGFNEVLTLLTVFFLFTITTIAFINKKEERQAIFWQFAFSLLFASILIFSPGNTEREGIYVNNNNLMSSFVFSLLQVIRFTFSWTFSLGLILASIFYPLLHEEWKKHSIWVTHSFYLNRWVSLALLVGITFICVFPVYWATGILGQHRTLNVAYFFFLIMWFINLSIWLNHFKNCVNIKITELYRNKIAILLLLSILFTGNGYYALIDIFSGDAQEFSEQLNQRHKLLKNATKTHTPTVTFTSLRARPKTLFVTEVSTDPKHWTNRGYNTYFKLNPDSTSIYTTSE